MAKDPAVRSALGDRYRAVPVVAGAQWGTSSTELVKVFMDERTVAEISTDRNSSHLAEQLGNRLFVPVVALSSDRALTSMNVPWIFRMPADAGLPDAVKRLVAAADQAGPTGAASGTH